LPSNVTTETALPSNVTTETALPSNGTTDSTFCAHLMTDSKHFSRELSKSRKSLAFRQSLNQSSGDAALSVQTRLQVIYIYFVLHKIQLHFT
jgi:hypothetical protein